jgi:hypothetical protein
MLLQRPLLREPLVAHRDRGSFGRWSLEAGTEIPSRTVTGHGVTHLQAKKQNGPSLWLGSWSFEQEL